MSNNKQCEPGKCNELLNQPKQPEKKTGGCCCESKCNPTCETEKQSKIAQKTTTLCADCLCENKCPEPCDTVKRTKSTQSSQVCEECACQDPPCKPECEEAKRLKQCPGACAKEAPPPKESQQPSVCEKCECSEGCNDDCLKKKQASKTCETCKCDDGQCKPECKLAKDAKMVQEASAALKAASIQNATKICETCKCEAGLCKIECEMSKQAKMLATLSGTLAAAVAKSAADVKSAPSKQQQPCEKCECDADACNKSCEKNKLVAEITKTISQQLQAQSASKVCVDCKCESGGCKPECEALKNAKSSCNPTCSGVACNTPEAPPPKPPPACGCKK